MKSRIGASLPIALATVFSATAYAADLPEVKASPQNAVPECATPGRLMAYTKARNPRLDPRFHEVATHYMRHGEEMGVRWDVAFFQMILETGALRFGGDVRADQNNFAGLGASGGGARGERFSDISTGVKAHLQHLLMYAGDRIDAPVAERTRQVQEWGVLTKWQQSIDGPMTYALVARKWAPSSRNYVRDVSTITDVFYEQYCNAPDPQPELVQEARRGRSAPATVQVAAATSAPAESAPAAAPGKSGTEIAKQRIEEERKESPPLRTLGAGMIGATAAAAETPAAQPQQDSPPVTLLNGGTETAQAAPEKNTTQPTPDNKTKTKSETKALAENTAKSGVQTASIGTAATQLKLPSGKSEPPAAKADAASGKCKVWTASYGGQRAVIIKAVGSETVNYTVLDVTEANEKREIDAYIAAYAKGGERIGSFPSQTKALHKAFELCPEG